MLDTSKDSPFLIKKSTMFSSEFTEFEEDGVFFSATEEEVIGVQHLLAEPECNRDMVDSILGFDLFGPQKGFNAKDFSCDVEYNYRKYDGGAEDSDITCEEKTKLEFIDGPLQLTDEVLQATTNIPATCDDYFLDNGSLEGYNSEQLGPESQSSGLNKRAEPSADSNLVLESTHTQNSFLLDNMTSQELHEAFMNMFGRETLVKDKQWLKKRILFGLQNLGKFEKNSGHVDHSFNLNNNESKSNFSLSAKVSRPFTGVLNEITMIGDQHEQTDRLGGHDLLETLSSDVDSARFCLQDSEEKKGSFVTERRSRKPTQRYADEFLKYQSTRHNKKCRVSYRKLRNTFLHSTSPKQPIKKGNVATVLNRKEESFREAIQVPFGFPILKECSKKSTSFQNHESEDFKDFNNTVLDNNDNDTKSQQDLEDESSEVESEDECIASTRKGRMQRKQNKYWTAPEMIKLIEGISLYGVGKWSEIKNMLFLSASHRTPVDLKDKWRNLLRASGTHLHSKKKVKQGGKHAPRQMQLILCRVRELADLHPYPTKECNIEDSFSASIAPHTPASTSEESMPFASATSQ